MRPSIDYIELDGPTTLSALVAAIGPAAASPPADATVTIVDLEGDVYATVQYDAVDRDTWPYMVTIESGSDDLAAVRIATLRIADRIQRAGWRYRLTSDAQDGVLSHSAGSQITFDTARAIVAGAASVRGFFGEDFQVADAGWENDDVYLVAVQTPDGPAFDAPDLLVDKRTGALREVYGMLGRDPVSGLVPVHR
ncbi:MAG: hypothetical protein JST91_26695 [Actinobacteria bacterium]|nr:hypothetical protein [Actinomycetota bacterium]